MESLQVNRNLCADFNKDLLKINTKIHYNIMDKPNIDDNTDSNSNFECFMKHFMELKKQCLPKKKVRFNKKKRKVNAWLTPGILISINSKNIL